MYQESWTHAQTVYSGLGTRLGYSLFSLQVNDRKSICEYESLYCILLLLLLLLMRHTTKGAKMNKNTKSKVHKP